MSFKTAYLFGGAISMEAPSDVIDVSTFREVPDTQEVFLMEKETKLDQALIVDLLETVQRPTLPEVISVHLSDVLDDPPQFLAPLESYMNPTIESDVHTFLVKPAPSKQETETVKLFMFFALIRLSQVHTDVLLTMTVPHETGPVSEDLFSEKAQAVLNDGDGVLVDAYKVIHRAASSFSVLEWSLFD